MLGTMSPGREAQSATLEVEPRETMLCLQLGEATTAVLGLPRRRLRVTGGLIALADLVAAVLAMSAAIAIGLPITGPGGIGVALAAVASSALSGFYRRTAVRLRKTHLGEASGLLQMGLSAGLVLATVASRPLTPGETVAAAGALVTVIALHRHALYLLAESRAAAERCLMVGDRTRLEEFERRLKASGSSLDIVARVEPHRIGSEDSGRRSVEALIAESAADRVIVLGGHDVDRAAQAARRARNAGATVTIVPPGTDTLGAEVVPELIGGSVAFSVRAAELTAAQQRLKRAFDIVGATVILTVLAPLMLALAAAVKLTSPGPVLFCQRRTGRDGEIFCMHKFRSMIQDAETRKADLLHRNEAGDGLFKVADDPRITGVGRILRKTSLDELPQLFNVLNGQMSLVGPRPLVPDEDGRINGWHRDRLRLAPGMTGPWQVMGSARIGLRDMVLLDHHYVSNWSLWADVQVLVRTAGVVLTRRGM